MKFITTQDEQGKEEVFLFPQEVHHDAMAEILGRIKNQTHGNWHRVRREPVAAGFVDASGKCYGHSETLGLKARPEDSALLAGMAFDGGNLAAMPAAAVPTDVLADERDACAKLLEVSNADLRLMAGEMSAQELRTVKAVLAAKARQIRARTK